MSIYEYMVHNSYGPKFWMLLLLHGAILTAGIYLVYRSVSQTDWSHPYCLSRFVNYIIASIGSGSVVTVLFYANYDTIALCAVHTILLLLLVYTYSRFRYDSNRILWKLSKLLHQ